MLSVKSINKDAHDTNSGKPRRTEISSGIFESGVIGNVYGPAVDANVNGEDFST